MSPCLEKWLQRGDREKKGDHARSILTPSTTHLPMAVFKESVEEGIKVDALGLSIPDNSSPLLCGKKAIRLVLGCSRTWYHARYYARRHRHSRCGWGYSPLSDTKTQGLLPQPTLPHAAKLPSGQTIIWRLQNLLSI